MAICQENVFLDLLEAIVVSPGQGLKSLDVIVDVDFFS